MGIPFLSYSSKDKEFMFRLRDDLRAAGLEIWIDERIALGNHSWTKTIQKAIESADCLLVILSPSSNKSVWVERELAHAQTHNVEIIPILVKGTKKSSLPFIISTAQLIDMSKNYQSQLPLLVSAIRDQVATKEAKRNRRKRGSPKNQPPLGDISKMSLGTDSLRMTLDKVNEAKFRRAIELGEPAQFQGLVEGLPKEISENFDLENTLITIIPHLPNEQLVLDVQYLDDKGAKVFESSSIQMRLVQTGTLYKKWFGQDTNWSLKYTFSLDWQSQNGNISFRVQHEDKNREAVKVYQYLKISDRLVKATTIKLLNRSENSEYTLAFDRQFPKPQISEEARRLIRALAQINIELAQKIEVPEHYSLKTVADAEEAMKIISEGITSQLLAIPDNVILVFETSVSGAKETLVNLEKDDDPSIVWPGPEETVMELLNHHLEFGPTEYVYCGMELLNRQEVVAKLTEPNLDEQEKILLHFSFDRSRSYTRFLNWYTDDSQPEET